MNKYIAYKFNSIINYNKKHYKVVHKNPDTLECDGCAFYLERGCCKFNCNPNPGKNSFVKVINIL